MILCLRGGEKKHILFENIIPEHTGQPNTLYTYIPVINADYPLAGVLSMRAWCIQKQKTKHTRLTKGC